MEMARGADSSSSWYDAGETSPHPQKMIRRRSQSKAISIPLIMYAGPESIPALDNIHLSRSVEQVSKSVGMSVSQHVSR